MSGAARCVLFDLDGTLLDTWHLYMEAFRRTLEPHFNRRLSDADIMALQPHAEQRVLLDLIQEVDFTSYFERFLTHYSLLHDSLFGGPYAGVLDMLHALRAQGAVLGIVTGKSRDAWRITATRLEEGFEDLFDVVLTDDDVRDPKPSPEGLLLALDVLDLQPSRAVFIGDSQRDRQAARAAGLPFGAALWPRGAEARGLFADPVGAGEADAAFTDPAAVLAWVTQTDPTAHLLSNKE